MSKFHVTDDGPKPCRAKPGNCPVGGEHFESEVDAQKNYESRHEPVNAFTKNNSEVEVVNYSTVLDPEDLDDEELGSIFDQVFDEKNEAIDSIDFPEKYGALLDLKYGENKMVHGWEVSVYSVNLRGREYYVLHFDDGGDADERPFEFYDSAKAACAALEDEEYDWFERHGIRM